MSRSPLWREFESGSGPLLHVLRCLVLGGGLLFLSYSGVLLLPWQRQMLFAGVTIVIAMIVNRRSHSHLGTLMLLLLSVYSTYRYAFWRVESVVAFLRDPLTRWGAADVILILLLLLAELYSFATLILGYMQVLWPLQRAPMPLPDDPGEWPAVDLLIPTFNEPLSVLRFTALAAMNIDWPAEKLNVFILDDGRREQVRAFAEEAGIGYIARAERTHAKAGNLNHALPRLHSPYVAVFDCDHVPTRSFLQLTMGWMLRDRALAVLQTPHHFYSPDPFERNLDHLREIPRESDLYYRVIQDGNDFWNATCFCGSAAVLRRSALDRIGGFAVESLTEDALTSLRLQMHGFNTAYINVPQSAGLAPERLSGYIRQQTRWTQGMLQILKVENPLFAPGLSIGQRLCYFQAAAHFLFPLPRLIFLLAPLGYLVLGRVTIPGFWATLIAYALPHLVLSALASARIQGEHRHPFWDHVYETVLAPFLLLPGIDALLRRSEHPFEVTPKGGVVDNEHFDRRAGAPFLLLFTLNVIGVLAALGRLVHFSVPHVPVWLGFLTWPARMYEPHHAGIVAVNLVWTLFNMMLLGVALAVARETRQRRRAVRLSVALPSDIILADGSMLQGNTSDLSTGGVRTWVSEKVNTRQGDSVSFVFPLLDGTATFSAKIVGQQGKELRARFDKLTLQEQEALATLLYSRADSWIHPKTDAEAQHNPLRSLGYVLGLSLQGLWPGTRERRRRRASLATSIVPLLLIFVMGSSGRSTAQGSAVDELPAGPVRRAPVTQPGTPAVTPAQGFHSLKPAEASLPPTDFHQSVQLAELGLPAGTVMRGLDSVQQLHLFIPRDRVVRAATLSLRYRTSPSLIAGLSHIAVSVNGVIVATLPVTEATASSTSTASIELPPDLLTHENRLGFEFVGHYTTQCEDPANAALWAQIDPNSTVELSGSRLTMTADLGSLPLPFYDRGMAQPSVPIVFPVQPSAKAVQAAAIVASWFGSLAAPEPIRFPVSVGAIPTGNAILLVENGAQLPDSLKDAVVSGAGVAIHANPSDPASSILVLSGENADDLLTSARALVLHQSTWQGPRIAIRNFVMPAQRRPDDAPRWMRTDVLQTFADLSRAGAAEQTPTQTGGELQTMGSSSVRVPLVLPPDLDFADRENLPLRLDYRYNSVPLGEGSTLEVYVNGAYVSSTPMPHADRASRVLETVAPVPVADLRPSENALDFRFKFHRALNANCTNQSPPSLEGAVVGDSSLDITGISHSAELPDLERFAGAGYPFTRLADLGETAIVIPSQPTVAELETLLLMMGHFSAKTGYPVLRVTVIPPSEIRRDGTRDYLVLGSAQDQPGFQALMDAAPVQVDGDSMHIRNSGGLSLQRWWTRFQSGGIPAAQSEVDLGGGLPDAVIQEFEWPARSRRTVVALLLDNEEAAGHFADAFPWAASSGQIRGTVSVLRGDRFTSVAAAVVSYRVGENTLLERIARTLQQFPWIVAVVAAILCFLMAVLLQAWLRIRARTRLQGSE